MNWAKYILCFFSPALIFSCDGKAPVLTDFDQLTEEAQRQSNNALASMTTAEGVEAALFAAEPILINPTNIAVDARGRVWVCEARNYRLPYNPAFPEREEGDRILILEDTKGDGKADKVKVFYQGKDIDAALGIVVLGNQVIVSSSPNIFVFTDENGDDKPDRRDTLFTGLDGYDSDHGAHAFIFGPDGKLYFNFGNTCYQLRDKHGEMVLDQEGHAIATWRPSRELEPGLPMRQPPYHQGMAFRCDFDVSNVEVLGHNFRNNYELAVDAFGNIWQSDNDDDGNRGVRINYVMEYGNYGYVDEITGAGWRTRRIGLEEDIPSRHWHQNDPGVVPNLLLTGAGSPTGICFYDGKLLPEPFRNQIIHCEALDNVVRAYPVVKDGSGFRADILPLMWSKDQWFRPSDVCAAPDGSLFVADWYDPGVGGNKMDDIQRGRIYRLAPKAKRYKTPRVKLNTPRQAIRALLNPNMDTRYQAWRKLEAWGLKAEPALSKLWREGEPLHRAQALWLLARLPGKTRQYLEAALKDDDEDIRITALRAARQLDPENLPEYIAGASVDVSLQVRRQAAIALRQIAFHEEAPRLWAELALRHQAGDRWSIEALGIAAERRPSAFIQAWRERVGDTWNNPAGRDVVWRVRAAEATPLLAALIADPAADSSELPRYFRAFHFKPVEDRDRHIAGLIGVEHPHRKAIRIMALAAIDPSFVRDEPKLRAAMRDILPDIEGSYEWLTIIRNMGLKEHASKLMDIMLSTADQDHQFRVDAGHLFFDLGGTSLLEQHLARLDLLERRAVFAKLGDVHHKEAVALLSRHLRNASGMPYPYRVQLVESLGNSWDGQHLLYDLIRARELDGELKNAAALKLMNCWNPEIRQVAPTFLSSAKSSGGVLPPVETLLAQKGNIANGKEVYDAHCANCHQINGQGVDFGPDLSTIGAKLAKQALYTSILYPSAGINFGYEGFVVKLRDNTMLNGIITSDTPTQVTLKMIGGMSVTYDKSRIASISPMEESLMTANLQAVMSERELVNLVEYLASLK
jgi:putative membrane-bound dehydrogenase-like protein